MTAEVNFDGLVGPTHNYAGLSEDNLAAAGHKEAPSNPREAALQGLAKMKALHDQGLPQAIIPPLFRPDARVLCELGFRGSSPFEVLADAAQRDPYIFRNACSASSMWTANAATVAPSADTRDGRVHFTIANLSSKLHRALEAGATETLFRQIFADPAHFSVHPPLQAGQQLSDEGAANHTRLWRPGHPAGLHVFVYGRDFRDEPRGGRFWPRQTLEASRTVARLHGLNDTQVLYLKQSREAIDAGVFHNDVIAVGHEDFYLFHEMAYADPESVAQELRAAFHGLTGGELKVRIIRRTELSMEAAVQSYLFNSQILTINGKRVILLPEECRENAMAAACVQTLLSDPACPIEEALYMDLRQSMNNGGGPACLRLRVPLTLAERQALRGRVLFDDALYLDLCQWVERHYRSHLSSRDLADPRMWEEVQQAYRELGRMLELPELLPMPFDI